MNVEEYVGEETIKRMRKTKWYALARFIDAALYAGTVVEKGPHSKRFETSERVYVGQLELPHGKSILGHEDVYIDMAKGLRELMHECERMALKEVT